MPYLNRAVPREVVGLDPAGMERLGRRFRAVRRTYQGGIALRAGDRDGAVEAVAEALEIDPVEPGALRLRRTLESLPIRD